MQNLTVSLFREAFVWHPFFGDLKPNYKAFYVRAYVQVRAFVPNILVFFFLIKGVIKTTALRFGILEPTLKKIRIS